MCCVWWFSCFCRVCAWGKGSFNNEHNAKGKCKAFHEPSLGGTRQANGRAAADILCRMLQDAKTWKKPQQIFEADLPKLERDTEWEGPKFDLPAAPIDPAQQDRNERNMRGIRMKMREKCEKLYKNRKFKDFQHPVLENHQARFSSARAAPYDTFMYAVRLGYVCV